MNTNQTKVMYTSTQYRLDRLQQHPLKCGSNTIEHVNSYVYLGIILDAGMSLNLFALHLYDRIQIKVFSHCLKFGNLLIGLWQIFFINKLFYQF